MLELLCISDLHLGEEYGFLNYSSHWKWSDQTGILPLYNSAARLAGLTAGHRPEVRVGTLVLLGDIFELATARIQTAASAGQEFFSWLLQWLRPERVIYVPGNHDHVFWMWWCIEPENGDNNWWEINPGKAKELLMKKYERLTCPVSSPDLPVGVQDKARRKELIRCFFGPLADPSTFFVSYPAFSGPACGPPGFRNRPFKTLFTHGHFNDPTFVRPDEAGLVAQGMHKLVDNAPDAIEMTSLNAIEKTTWRYTNHFWYPPETESTLGERLYLASIIFETGNPCLHPVSVPSRYLREPAPDLNRIEASNNDYYNLMAAALGSDWYVNPYIFIYGHTHHGGAMPLDPSFLLYNTGGWLKKTNDRPPHTHLFAVNEEGIAQMIRADFA